MASVWAGFGVSSKNAEKQFAGFNHHYFSLNSRIQAGHGLLGSWIGPDSWFGGDDLLGLCVQGVVLPRGCARPLLNDFFIGVFFINVCLSIVIASNEEFLKGPQDHNAPGGRKC